MNTLWRITVCFIALMLFLTACTNAAEEEVLTIRFANSSSEKCFGTILTPSEYWGLSYRDSNGESAKNDEIWQAFSKYQDIDGLCFLKFYWNISESNEISWSHYPPLEFKILLYSPSSDAYAVSGILKYDKNAGVYYAVDMNGIVFSSHDAGSDLETIKVELKKEHRQFDKAHVWAIVRALIAITVEVAVALFFKLKERKALTFIIITNTLTQLLLNIALHFNYLLPISVSYKKIFVYILAELLIFVSEACLYALFLDKLTGKPNTVRFYIVYALIANLASAVLSIGLTLVFPNSEVFNL